MGRRAISDGEETQERHCYTQNITRSEKTRVFSPECPQHSSHIPLVKQELPDVDGREIHVHDVSFSVFSERVYLLSLGNQEMILQAYVLKFLEGRLKD